MTKRILIFVLVFLLVGGTATFAANSTAVVSPITDASYATITIDSYGIGNSTWFTNQGILQTDCTPFIINGRLFVPFRWAVEVFGGSATWESRPDGTTSLVTLYAPPIKKEVATSTVVVPLPYPIYYAKSVTETVYVNTPTVYETITNTVVVTNTVVETVTVYVLSPPPPPQVITVTIYVPTPTLPTLTLVGDDLVNQGDTVYFYGFAPVVSSTVTVYAAPYSLWPDNCTPPHEPYLYTGLPAPVVMQADVNGYFSGEFVVNSPTSNYYGIFEGLWRVQAFQGSWVSIIKSFVYQVP